MYFWQVDNVTLPLYLTVGSDSAAAVAVLLPLWSLSNFAKAFRLTSCFWDGSVDNKISSLEIWSHLKVELNVMIRKLCTKWSVNQLQGTMACFDHQRKTHTNLRINDTFLHLTFTKSWLFLQCFKRLYLCRCPLVHATAYMIGLDRLFVPISFALSRSCLFTAERHTDVCIWPTSFPGFSLTRYSVRTSRREAWLEPSWNLTAYMETE